MFCGVTRVKSEMETSEDAVSARCVVRVVVSFEPLNNNATKRICQQSEYSAQCEVDRFGHPTKDGGNPQSVIGRLASFIPATGKTISDARG